jgi:gliding motility-associated-like protein
MRIILLELILVCSLMYAGAQERPWPARAISQNRLTATCPPNIDFEYGDFTNWTCFIGTTFILSGQNNLSLTPSNSLPRRHVLQNAATLDPYGQFSVLPPLGGQYTLKLGNDSVGAHAERVRYVINVPANEPNYSITFQYAVVLENPDANQGGAHTDQEQPRFTAKLYDPQTNEYLSCGSFTFVASLVGIVPGFAVSSTVGGPWSLPPAKVWYKPWSSVYVDLSNYTGRTLYLEFTTADCTRRGHFGYAYVDVFACGIGAEASYTCGPPDTINLLAPDGFRFYKWYNNDFTTLYGSTQQVAITPAPPGGGTFKVVVTPFNNSDCPTCDCSDTLSVTISAPIVTGELLLPLRDTLCPGENITLYATGGTRYQWYKNDVLVLGATADTILASAPGSYAVDIIDASGCRLRAQRTIRLFEYLPPAPNFSTTTACINIPLLFQNNSYTVTPAEYYWDFGDGSAITNDFQPTHIYSTAGSYSVKLIAQSTSCLLLKDSIIKTVSIINPAPNLRYPTVNAIKNVAQNLTARPGASTYQWTPPTGLNNPTFESPIFLYDRPQEYLIRVRANNGCVNIDTLLVRMFASYTIYVPNAFSPNGDGVNDRIYPILIGNIQLKNFRVFSRWGTLLFETNNPSPSMGWDGRWNNTNQPADTYTWTAEVITQGGEMIKKSGNFVLIR